MRIERTFGEYFRYSLHDARVKKIEHKDNNLILHFDYIFSYCPDSKAEYTHRANIIFENVDSSFVEILVFDNTLLTDFRGKSVSLLDFIATYTAKANFKSWYLNNAHNQNKEIRLYTKKGLLSNSYDKKSFWYEWISRAHYEFEKLKPLRPEEPIEIRAVKTSFTIADTTNGKVFINLFDGSVWHFTDDSDWLNDIDLYHCEKYADSFSEFLELLTEKTI